MCRNRWTEHAHRLDAAVVVDGECHKYLPTQLVYYRAPAREGEDTLCDGMLQRQAAGNTLEEAILQGFFELVERDAVALWWYNRLRKPGVAVETFGEPYLLQLAEHYRRHYRRDTWALDLTSDLGIPVFAAVSKVIEGEEERLLFGLGCHLDARIALQRAFAEMNQMLGMAHAGKDGELSLDDGEPLEWLRNATVANQPYMAPGRISRSVVTAIIRCSTAAIFCRTSTTAGASSRRWAWRCSCWIRPARTRGCRWSRSWCRACGTSGRVLPRGGCMMCRSRWAGWKSHCGKRS